MSRIRIKNFGPIKEGFLENDGWMDVSKVTVLIGNQGSGKSTVAKLISTMKWIEKTLYRGDLSASRLNRKNIFRQLLSYHRLESFFYNYDSLFEESEIEFCGDAFNIRYLRGDFKVEKNSNNKYNLPQIVYVPAERNFISHIRKTKEIKLFSMSLREFLTEFEDAKAALRYPISLPINDVKLQYDMSSDILNVIGKDYKIKLSDSSSGLQSAIPLYLVSWYHSTRLSQNPSLFDEPISNRELSKFRSAVLKIVENSDLTDQQKRIAISALSSKYNKAAFINIVEEPEQNLFPCSQWELLKSLLSFNNFKDENKLIMTSHSPYIINYLVLAVKAWIVYNKIENNILGGNGKSEELIENLEKVVPIGSLIAPHELAIYELEQNNGTISKLDTYDQLPSDENFLNRILQESNELFDKLLDIEEACQ
jgi:predicted ATPase